MIKHLLASSDYCYLSMHVEKEKCGWRLTSLPLGKDCSLCKILILDGSVIAHPETLLIDRPFLGSKALKRQDRSMAFLKNLLRRNLNWLSITTFTCSCRDDKKRDKVQVIHHLHVKEGLRGLAKIASFCRNQYSRCSQFFRVEASSAWTGFHLTTDKSKMSKCTWPWML